MSVTAALLIVCVAAGLAEPQPPPSTDQPLSEASLSRIRTSLRRPPSKLTLAERKPDFAVSIWKKQEAVQLMAPILDFTVAPGSPLMSRFAWSPQPSRGGGGTDVLGLIGAARRAVAKRAAIEHMRETIAEYCAAQPNGGGGIAICSPGKR